MSHHLYLPVNLLNFKTRFLCIPHNLSSLLNGFKLNNIQPIVTKAHNLELYNGYYHKMGSRVWPNSKTSELVMVTDQELPLLIINPRKLSNESVLKERKSLDNYFTV